MKNIKTLLTSIFFLFSLNSQLLADAAVSYDYNTRKYAYCTGEATQNFAKNCAKRKCGTKCNPLVSFSKTCFAFINDQSIGKIFWNYNDNQNLAINGAISRCKVFGGKQCIIEMAICDKN